MEKVRPKKHLGQHFLKDESIAKKITSALLNVDSLPILEVGPGMGVLTGALISRSNNYVGIDLDKESIQFLRTHFPELKDRFILGDFLQLDLGEFGKKITIIGNFPYNISSQIFFKVYDNRDRVTEVVGMVQKEVADRIVAQPGSKTIGILSILLQAFYDIEYLFTVKPGSFNPPPKVNSAVIRLVRNEVTHLDCDEDKFRQVVKNGFGKRRKTLRNALKNLILPPSVLNDPVLDRRAEQLSVSDFVELTNKIS